jgi:hypothetical protein
MVVTSPLSPAPARDFPSMNALNAVRYFFDATPIETIGGIQQPSALLKLNKPMLIGTIPGKAFVVGGSIHVKTATTGAATLDIGTKANPVRFLTALPLNAALRDDDLLKTKIGIIGDSDTPIYATLKGSADLSNGIFSILLYYYAKLGD